MCLMIFIWYETNWDGDNFFYLDFLTSVKLSQLTKLSNWRWFNLDFLFSNITNRMAKQTSGIGICFESSNLYEICETLSDRF